MISRIDRVAELDVGDCGCPLVVVACPRTARSVDPRAVLWSSARALLRRIVPGTRCPRQLRKVDGGERCRVLPSSLRATALQCLTAKLLGIKKPKSPPRPVGRKEIRLAVSALVAQFHIWWVGSGKKERKTNMNMSGIQQALPSDHRKVRGRIRGTRDSGQALSRFCGSPRSS